MSERRTLLSRPRTKVYDCNYSIGEKYYKPMVDELDRKYSGRSSLSPFTPTVTRTRSDDEFSAPRRPFSGSSDFETLSDRRSRLNSESRSVEDDLEEDIIKSMKRLKAIRASKAASVDDDYPSSLLNGSLNGTSKHKKLNFTSKLLDSVGINERTQNALEGEILKKRTVKIPSMFDEEPSFTKWTALRDSPSDEMSELSAMARARQSRARIADIENEMDAVTERGAARDRRISNIRALIAGEDAFPETVEAYKSKKLSSRVKKVSF